MDPKTFHCQTASYWASRVELAGGGASPYTRIVNPLADLKYSTHIYCLSSMARYPVFLHHPILCIVQTQPAQLLRSQVAYELVTNF